ncbi:MAG: 3-dehydroquinate synthase [Deltaproteobacteria bacterium]|jgi:3-dehydroquinate synthase|nr:MAG: 3-dehydroquinate synthase [Deltaproteobacteria bacterium]
MDKITVNLGSRSYPICFGYSNLVELGKVIREFDFSDRIGVVTNPEVARLFFNTVERSLRDAGFNVFTIEIPDGEGYKSLEWTSILYDKLVSLKMDRKSALVALGGGVIGDITGFAAATFLRGIPYIQVPTTLLAQVDSSVGGKTGVNHPKGKNLIGAFYQPRLVFIDVDTLKTLPESEFISGLAEVIKYGIIWDSDLFKDLEDNLERIIGLDRKYILRIVKRCCSIKAKIVEEDEKESGVRSVLNFGHTIGHAIEALTDYKSYKHGEAVAIGMVTATQLSVEMGVCNESVFHRVKTLIQRAGLPTDLPEFPKDEYVSAIELDKKMRSNKVKFVLAEDIGRVKFADLAAEDISKYLN